jgi:hypothetical protein
LEFNMAGRRRQGLWSAALALGLWVPAQALPSDPETVLGSRKGTPARVRDLQPGADLSGTRFHMKANLREADFRQINLVHADLGDCDYTGADFRGADLRTTRLAGAILAGCDFRDARLTLDALADDSFDEIDLSGTLIESSAAADASGAGRRLGRRP